jgi:hypothetical protein
MRLFAVLAVVVFSCLATGQSFAQLGPKQQAAPTGGSIINRITPEQLASALTAAGYKSQVKTTNDNQKFVASSIHGFNVVESLFDCNAQGCGNLQFIVWFNDKVSLDFVNAWNAQYRFAKAAIDSDGDVAFSIDIYLDGGVTLDNVKNYAKVFDYMLGEVTKFKP